MIVIGLPLFDGKQLAVNVAMINAVRGDSTAYPKAAVQDGVRLEAALKYKEQKYPELVTAQRCKLVVAATELGER